MSLQDPVSDMLTRIRNGQMAGHKDVVSMCSNLNIAIVSVLKKEGFVKDYQVQDLGGNKKSIRIVLKYCGERMPVIESIRRVSCPSARVYWGKKELVEVKQGLGVAILSTALGVMTNKRAKKLGVGGEVLCEVM